MTRPTRHLIPLSLVLALVGCRFNANRPPTPTASASPGSDVVASPAASSGSHLPSSLATPTPRPSVSVSTEIPVIANLDRDLRHVPQDMALGTDGTIWLLADDGIWQRKSGSPTWTADATLKTLDLNAVPTDPAAELVTDPAGTPWILDPASGKLWKHTDTATWTIAATGLVGAKGLSVAADGTAYAVAASDNGPIVWQITSGNLQPLSDKAWKTPVTTAVDAKGNLRVIDDGPRMVYRYGTDEKLASFPPALGHLTIGRDADGTPLIVGGGTAFTAVRINDQSLGYPTLPVTSLPMTTTGTTNKRLFVLPSGQYLAMVRFSGALGEIRTVTAIGRKPGAVYAPSSSYTGTAKTVQALARKEADKLGDGYQLCRIRGTNKSSDATNRSTAWYYDYFRTSDASLVTVSIAPQGLQIERAYMPDGLAPPTALGEITLDSQEAWSKAVKAGMPNQAMADIELQQEGSQAFWRIAWTTGGQTYKVDATTGDAGLETQ